MSKHTPGPWAAKRVGLQQWWINAPFGDPTIGYNFWDGLAEVYGSDDWPESGRKVAEANARLIAAAPELLQACEAMIEWDDREEDHAVDFAARMALCERAFDLARAAIAKAKGGAE